MRLILGWAPMLRAQLLLSPPAFSTTELSTGELITAREEMRLTGRTTRLDVSSSANVSQGLER